MEFIFALIVLFGLWMIFRWIRHPKQTISESELNIALCESPDDVDKNVPFRLIDDSDNMVRIKQDYPLSSNDNWVQTDEEWYVKVSGVSYRKDSVIWFIAGTSHEIEVVREPMPDYPDALAVYGRWKDKYGKMYRQQLGYVQDYDAQEISASLRKSKGCRLSAKPAMMFIPTKDKSPGLRINVALFEPRKSKGA